MKIVKMTIIISSVVILVCCYFASIDMFFSYNAYVDPIAYSTLFILIASLCAFFISNKIFIRWIVFTVLWYIFAWGWIIDAPQYSGKFFDMGPSTKEDISIWMGSLFVIISLGMFAVMTLREKYIKPQHKSR